MLNIFQYLENNKGKEIPLEYKIIYNLHLTVEELIFNGDLNLHKSDITSLPDNLTINGYLNLSCSKITSLPNNLTIKNNLYLYGTKISELPDNLTIGNRLICRETPLADKIMKDYSLLNKYSQQIKGDIFYQ